MQQVELYDLDRAPYKPTWELQTAIQQRLVREKKARQKDKSSCLSNEVLLFVEHPHVFTLGKSGDAGHLLKDRTDLQNLNAEYVETDRGGDITYHGPGQIVGYPILDLDRHFTDIHKYMRCLEEVIIRTCRDYDIEAGRIEGLTGVWVDDAKVCAMGVRCSRWVTMHGFALNVNADLNYFNYIIPCGITDKKVTSLQKILGRSVDVKEVKNYVVKHFQEVFGVSINEGHNIDELNNEFSYLSSKHTQAVST